MIVALLALACQPAPEPVDTRIEGLIYCSADQTTDAIAIRDGVVVAVGEAARAADAEAVIALGSSVAIPGFHDAHTHIVPGSFVQDRLVMLGTSSMDSVVNKLAQYAQDAPEEPWLIGFGWVYALMDDLDGRRLDEVVSDRPVLLVDSAGHNALVNQTALAMAGITADTPDPEGGVIVRDPKTGEPTGLLQEAALALVSEIALGAYDDADFLASMEAPLAAMSDVGLTSVSDIMASPGFDLAFPWLFQQLDDAGALPLRVHYHVPVFTLDAIDGAAALGAAYDTERVRMAGIKMWVDGSSGTAEGWVSEPLQGTTDDYGSAYFTAEDLLEAAYAAEAAGLRMRMHVTGDAAVTAVLDALETVAAANGGLQQQHTLEHVVLIQDADRIRMAELGVVASIQPTHALVAGLGVAPDAWGDERFAQAYDFRSLADAGVPLAMGTDWPVWPTPDGTVGLWAAQSLDDHGLTVEEALDAYTAGSARAAGLAGELGCLLPGCLADVTILGQDPLTVEGDALADIPVEGVLIGGEPAR